MNTKLWSRGKEQTNKEAEIKICHYPVYVLTHTYVYRYYHTYIKTRAQKYTCIHIEKMLLVFHFSKMFFPVEKNFLKIKL